MSKLFRLTVLIAAALAAPAAALAAPPVWVIRDKDSTITLFGSVHILPKGADWRPKKVTSALAKAQDVWFEIPVDDATRLGASQAAIKLAMLPMGQSLLAMLDAPARAKFERVAASLNLPVGYLDQLRPWMAELTLSQAFMDKRGATIAQGVEEVISAAVPVTAMRRAFETPEQQLDLYANSPVKDQLAMLTDTLGAIEDDPGGFDKIVGVWMKGDVAAITRDAVVPLKQTSPYLYEALIIRRNTNWVTQIEKRLAGSGDTLMVVGVGHLVGPDSVPAMLRKRGIKVEGP